MNLGIHVDSLRDQMLAAASAGGPDARAAVERLTPGLEAAMRLVLLEAISASADEITRELAPGAVEVRLRGLDPDFVVTLPVFDAGEASGPVGATSPTVIPTGEDEGGTARLNLRLPEGLKSKAEDAARREGLSLNAWLVRAAAAAVEGTQTQTSPRRPSGGQTYTGWVR